MSFQVIREWPRHRNYEVAATFEDRDQAVDFIKAKHALVLQAPTYFVEVLLSAAGDYLWVNAHTGGPKSALEICTYSIKHTEDQPCT